MHNSGMRVSSIRRRTAHDSYAYVPCGCCAAYYHSLSLPFSLSSSLLSPSTSFQCTPLIFWPLANTDTIEKSVVLHAAAESLFPSPISTSSRKKFTRYCFSTESNESLSRNVEEIDYVLSDTGHNWNLAKTIRQCGVERIYYSISVEVIVFIRIFERENIYCRTVWVTRIFLESFSKKHLRGLERKSDFVRNPTTIILTDKFNFSFFSSLKALFPSFRRPSSSSSSTTSAV